MKALQFPPSFPFALNHAITSGDTAFLVIKTNNSGISQFHRFTEVLKRRWKIGEELYSSIIIALTEAVTNAIEHGNKRKTAKTICISATRDEYAFSFTVEDQGEGFDHRRIPNPTEEENLLKPGGRGLFVMRQLSDYTHFSLGGRRVKMLFYK